MRNSSVLKWAKNNKNSKGEGKKNKEEKKWIHSPETLVSGHVVYLVKFLGSTEVDKPKGIDVVKQGIQKLKFNQQLKKSEGNKTPKVELTISVDGVAVQEPKTKKMLHQYPLHKISYCADDKAEKRFFSFIAKEGDTANHTCFVFVSDKLAEEITLTIGQAFELAYKKFLDTSGKDMEVKKQLMVLQKRVSLLEEENGELKKRLRDVANIKGQQDIQDYMHKHDITDIAEVREPVSSSRSSEVDSVEQARPKEATTTSSSAASELICLDAAVESNTSKLDGFSLDDLNDDDFNPRASSGSEEEEQADEFDPRGDAPPPSGPAPQVIMSPPALPPPRTGGDQAKVNMTISNDLFSSKASDPFAGNPFSGSSDPFGMSSFNANAPASNAKGVADSFQAGLTAGNFSLDELDPLKK